MCAEVTASFLAKEKGKFLGALANKVPAVEHLAEIQRLVRERVAAASNPESFCAAQIAQTSAQQAPFEVLFLVVEYLRCAPTGDQAEVLRQHGQAILQSHGVDEFHPYLGEVCVQLTQGSAPVKRWSHTFAKDAHFLRSVDAQAPASPEENLRQAHYDFHVAGHVASAARLYEDGVEEANPSFEQLRDAVVCLRLAGKTNRAQQLLALLKEKVATLPLDDAHATAVLAWETAIFQAVASQQLDPLLACVARGRHLRTRREVILAALWCKARSDGRYREAAPNYRGIRRAIKLESESVDATRELAHTKAWLECLRVVDRLWDEGYSVSDRARKLVLWLDGQTEALHPEIALLFWGAIEVWAADVRLYSLANEFRRERTKLSLAFTDGQLANVLNLPIRTREPTARQAISAGSQAVHAASLATGVLYDEMKHRVLPKSRRNNGKGTRDELVARHAKRLRHHFPALRGVIRKAGQITALYQGRLPAPIVAELERADVASRPLAPGAIRQVIERQLGQSVESLFSEWEDLPLATASVGQVHRATRRDDGREVAVKVLYPGIEKVFTGAGLSVAALAPLFRLIKPDLELREVGRALKKILLQECDFSREADFAQRFAHVLAPLDGVRVPAIHQDLSAKAVLTMDFLTGRHYADFKRIASQEMVDAAAAKIFAAYVRARFRGGLMNCDPHPGNYLFTAGSVALLDFGAAIEVDADYNADTLQIFELARSGDAAGIYDLYVKRGFVKPSASDDKAALLDFVRAQQAYLLEDDVFRFERGFIDRIVESYTHAKPMLQFSSARLYITRWELGFASLMIALNASANWHGILQREIAVT